MSVGRNDPCPCGSGKKYKKCCLGDGPTEAERSADVLRDAQAAIERPLAEFVRETLGEGAIQVAWDEFTLGGEYLDEQDAETQLFDPWLFYEWHPNAPPENDPDAAKSERYDGCTVSVAFLAAVGDTLPEPARHFITCVTAEPCSFYEVLDVVPGRRVTLRDVFRATEHEVVEKSASRSLQRGDVIFARVVPFKGFSLIIGCGEIALPPDAKIPLVETRKKLQAEVTPITAGFLHARSPEVRRAYFDLRDSVVKPAFPAVQNTDGEPLEMHTLTYAVPSADEAFQALKSLAVGVPEDDLLIDATRDTDGRISRVEFSWLKPGNKMNTSWDNTIIAEIRIDGDTLSVNTNSAERAQLVRDEIRRRLGDRAVGPTETIQPFDPATLRKRAQASPRAAAARSWGKAGVVQDPELRAAMQQIAESHWNGWIRTKIPALGGKTPLQAVKTPDGGEMVEAMLRSAERHQEQAPDDQPHVDFDAVRERLGLTARSSRDSMR